MSTARAGFGVKQAAEWTEAELLAALLRRDDCGWNELLRRYSGLVYRCIGKVTARFGTAVSAADVEEIFADVLFALLRHDMRRLRLFDPARGTKLGSWIGMISSNAAYDFLRAVGRRPMLDQLDEQLDREDLSVRSPLDELLDKERWAHFGGLVGELSDKDRVFLDLYFGRGLEASAVAEAMAISVKTVYSKKHKLRAQLRRRVECLRHDSAIADLAACAA